MIKKSYLLILLIFFCGSIGFTASTTNKEKQKKISLPAVHLSPEIIELIKTRKWEPAINKLNGIYKRDGDPKLKYYIAYCYEEMASIVINKKQFQDGIDLLNKSLIYRDDLAHPYIGLGFCYFSLSQYEDAEEAYLKALDLSPEDFQANSMLGEICYITNRLTEAMKYWVAALKILPENNYAKRRLEGLKKTIHLSADHEKEEAMIFSVSFDGSRKPHLRDLVLNMLIEISEQIDQELQLYPNRQIPVILLTNKAFADITGSPGWAGGAYEGHIKIPIDRYAIEPLRQVLTHEYIHAVIYDLLAYRCPWWLNEGIAQYFSGDNGGNQRKLKLANQMIKKGTVPDLKELPSLLKGGDRFKVKVAYGLALSAVKYLIDTYGTQDLQSILDLMKGGKSFSYIVSEITGYTFIQFQKNWKESHY